MRRLLTKPGFCRECRKNVEHVHACSSFLGRLLHAMTFSLVPRIFRLGSWHCKVCNNRTAFLPFRRSGALDFRPNTETLASDEAFLAAGNYIKRDLSLVMRTERNSRFSPKFRHGVVERILEGTATIQSIREELHLPEADVIAWIAEVVESQRANIKYLNRMVEVLLERSPETARLNADVDIMSAEREGVEQT